MFVQFAYREAGIEIPRLCGSQAYQAYYDKERFQIIDSVEEAKPGDIFFYRDYEYEGVSDEKDNWNEIHHSRIVPWRWKNLRSNCGRRWGCQSI